MLAFINDLFCNWGLLDIQIKKRKKLKIKYLELNN